MVRSRKSIERELRGPSLVEVTLGAVLSVALGAVLAAVWLVLQPVELVKSMPKEPDPDRVYYVAGNARSSLGKQWLRKRQMLNETGTVEIRLSEDELNTWMASAESQPDAEATGMLVLKPLNFRVNAGIFQIGVPLDLNVAGFQRSIVCQAQGRFERRGDRFSYVPDRLMIGTLNARRLPVVGDLIYGRLMAAHPIPEDLAQAWSGLNQVTVEDDVLVLARR